MRLCGISSRFQLLSPSTRQVTHALLTRPPLTYISLGFNVSPFDLHVLGTPLSPFAQAHFIAFNIAQTAQQVHKDINDAGKPLEAKERFSRARQESLPKTV